MEIFITIGLIAAAIFLVLILVRLLSLPLRWAFKLLLNAAVGFVFLFVFNFMGSYVGITLGINWLNALVAGALGIPGVILLLLLKLFF